MKYLSSTILLLSLLLISCLDNKKEATEHLQLLVPVNENLKLELLDWGGKGIPLIFLSGLDDNAHIFDVFAPQFTDEYHVYGLTRRGYGISGKPTTGYGIDTLAGDILSVLNNLNIDKAILIGHSIAGDEMSRFALLYPDRVLKLVYLDAAYDRTKWPSLAGLLPALTKPSTKDSSSMQNWKTFQQYFMSVKYLPDHFILNACKFSANGTYVGNVTSDTISSKVFKGLIPPDYKQIKTPALAVYAQSAKPVEFFPEYFNYDSANRTKADTALKLIESFRVKQRLQFEMEMQNGKAEVIKGGNHYVFISDEIVTSRLIRQFLRN